MSTGCNQFVIQIKEVTFPHSVNPVGLFRTCRQEMTLDIRSGQAGTADPRRNARCSNRRFEILSKPISPRSLLERIAGLTAQVCPLHATLHY